MTIFVRGENPKWFFNNLTGQVLDDTYWAFFLTNDLPYIPQPVYQDPNGISPWSNPIEFQPSGGLPDNLYFDPSLTYRIEIRQGPNQTDPLIWLIQNYVPGNGGGGSITGDPLTTAANIITNPQFADVYFESPLTFTQGSVGTYTVEVAPGWELVLTGSGTTVLTQGTIPGSANDFGNPAYYLEINNSGWTSALLVQTLTNNGAIFANGAVAVAFTAQAIGSAENVSVQYIPNGPGNSQNIFFGQINTGGFGQYYGLLGGPSNPFNPSINPNLGEAASVQIGFGLPGSGIVELTNIQVTGQSTPPTTDFVEPTPTTQGSVPNYQELTYEQMVNAEFHVYKNSIMNQSKDSILTGWNFGNNPWQFRSPSISNLANNAYTADQTIVVQQAYVTSATGNNISVGQGTISENLPFKVTAVTATNKFALIQYIDPASIRQFWNGNLSSRVMANVNSSHSTQCKFKMRLIYRTSRPSTVGQNEPIASWTNVDGSDPVFAAGWTAIAPLNDPEFTFDLTNALSFDFNQFHLPDSSNNNMTLGIVLYTTTNLNQNATADVALFYDISLVPNDFALPTQAETFDQTLRKCQYYYERSYDVGTATGTATLTGAELYPQLINASSKPIPGPFELIFNSVKNIPPTMTFYSALNANTSGVLSYNAYSGVTPTFSGDVAIGDWTAFQDSTERISYTPATATQVDGTSATYSHIFYHYTADSRLGQ